LVTFDTSAILALINRRDPDHERVREAALRESDPYVLPAGILAEVGYFLEKGFSPQTSDRFLDDVKSGVYLLDCGDRDVSRVHELVRRYRDLPLGLADAIVIACAERRGGRILTLDLRHFGVVAREGAITLVP
jgi:predicted nucleic acid-binding protein